jgi:hypothetical protein
MRMLILADDKRVVVGEEGYDGLNLSFLDPTIHAVQWYDTHGEVEHKDPATGKMTANREIQSIDEFQQAITVWQAAKDAAEAARLEAARIAAEAEAARLAAANAQT